MQIDADPTMVGLRYPFEVNLVGDARQTLEALLPMLVRKDDRSWRETVEGNVERWWTVLDSRGAVTADPINPERVFAELRRSSLPTRWSPPTRAPAPTGTRVISGFRGSMRGTVSGTLATMGCAVPYAIGAKFAHPDRPAYALVGDGAMQRNGMAELITIAKYWQEWADPRLVVMVLQNDDLNQVTWELRAMGGSPQFLPSQQIPSVDYGAFARRLGLDGIYVEDPDAVGAAWERRR